MPRSIISSMTMVSIQFSGWYLGIDSDSDWDIHFDIAFAINDNEKSWLIDKVKLQLRTVAERDAKVDLQEVVEKQQLRGGAAETICSGV